MLIQPITSQFDNKNFKLQNRKNIPSFKGELGAKVMKEITASTVKDTSGIKKILKGLRIGFLGLISMSKLQDILESVFEKEQALTEKEQALTEKEQALINTESIIKQAEMERIISATRAQYGIKNPEIKVYESVGEQIMVISEVLNKNMNKLKNTMPSTPQDIQSAMINNNKVIEYNMMQFMERIIGVSQSCEPDDLIEAIKLVKDDTGNLDIEKSAHFLSLLGFNNNTIASVVDSIKDFYTESKPDDNKMSGIQVNVPDFGKVGLSKFEYKSYVSLSAKLEALQKNYDELVSSRDKQVADNEKAINHNNDGYHYYKEHYMEIKRNILKEYEPKLAGINKQIAEIKSQIAEIVANAKTRSM